MAFDGFELPPLSKSIIRMSLRRFYKYGELYSALVVNDERKIEYTMVNTFLTLEGARPACIVGLSDASYATFKSVISGGSYGIIPYPYPLKKNAADKTKNYVIIGPSAKSSLLSSTIPIVRAGLINSSTNSEVTAFHEATGKLLGYLKPMNITKASGGKNAYIITYLNDEKLNGIMPQRVGIITDEEIRDYYKKPLDLLMDAYKNPAKYDYFPFKFTGPPELVIKVPSAGGRRRTRRRRANK